MHKIRFLWYRGIKVLDSAAEPRANATCDCRDFTPGCIAAKSDCRLKYNIGQRLRLCGTKTSVMVAERHLPGSSHHGPSLVNREEEVTTCTIRPCDSVCPDYFVKTSKNKFFKVSEGRLCHWALYFCLATVCTDFPFLTYCSTSLIITLRFQDISLFLDVSSVPESAIFWYRRVPRHVPQYYRKRGSASIIGSAEALPL